MKELWLDLKHARLVAIVAAAAICTLSFTTAALYHQSGNDSGADPVTSVSPDDYQDLAVNSGVPVAERISLDLCDGSPGEVSCFAGITKSPVASPSVGTAQEGQKGLTPADLQDAYNISQAQGHPTVAVVVAWAYSGVADDLNAYRATPPDGDDGGDNGFAGYDLGDCTIESECLNIYTITNGARDAIGPDNLRHVTNKDDNEKTTDEKTRDAWAIETAIDLDMVSAACPDCHLALYAAQNDSLNALLNAARIAGEHTDYVSMSWGTSLNGALESTPPANGKSVKQAGFDNVYFSHPGTIYFAATGDSGYDDVEYPAASTHVIAVGGTTLKKVDDPDEGARGWTETAWSADPAVDEGEQLAASSGCVPGAAQPPWQTDAMTIVGENAPCDTAVVSDVSAVASQNSPVSIYFDDDQYHAFGTSVATPILAGIYAAGGAHMNSLEAVQQIYANADKFNDVTEGDNGVKDNDNNGDSNCDGSILCEARKGWDGPTGVGTPNGAAIFAGLTTADSGSGPALQSDSSTLRDVNVTTGDDGAVTVAGTMVVSGDDPATDLSLYLGDYATSDDAKVTFKITFVDANGDPVNVKKLCDKTNAACDLSPLDLNALVGNEGNELTGTLTGDQLSKFAPTITDGSGTPIFKLDFTARNGAAPASPAAHTWHGFPAPDSDVDSGDDDGNSDSGDDGNSDSGNSDSGNSDSGNSDSGNSDSGNSDTGNSDTGNSDSGNSDSGNSDSGNSDSGNSDSGNSDTGNSDSGNSDTGNSDSGNSDTGNSDSGNSDSGNSDTGNSDSGNSDSGNADSGNTDSGNSDTGNSDTGNSDSGNSDSGNADSGNADSGNADSGNADSGNTDSGNSDSGNSDSGDSDDTAKTCTDDPDQDKCKPVAVNLTVVLSDLLGLPTVPSAADAHGDPALAHRSGTVFDTVDSDPNNLTTGDALKVLGQMPATEGLTPAYTPQRVFMIHMAKMLDSVLPF